ncbi:hypothetical protein CBER1_09015 [Cercospora berteroae]|uniref:Uncharacterized protein n=1 Tax=Cercospora berteroae TaxID=357750 RepID=A0A2S6CC30_9PEZI|nr:hypothetical protein CBER1_09015 [Cercospora berteroae]
MGILKLQLETGNKAHRVAVSYCTEVIEAGRPDVLHTKTGSVCTYNTIRSTTTPPSTTIFTASFPEQVAPSNQGNARTFPSTPDPTGGPQPFPDQLDGKCTVFQKKTFDQYGKWDWRSVDEELSKQQCVPFCAKAFAENLANNQTAANACISWASPPIWENYNFVGETQVAQGSCECNGRLITSIAEWFANTAVPAIEEIACKTWITAISTVVTGGLAAIPGVGGAVATVAHAAMQAAVTLAYTMETTRDAGQVFTEWLSAPSTQVIDGVCGNKYISEEGQQVLEAFWTAASAVGPAKIFANAARIFPPPWGKGGKDDKPDRPSPSPSGPSKPTDRTKSAEPSQSPKQCTEKHGDNCDATTISSYIVDGSRAVMAKIAITKTCIASNHPQAYAHYYSAIQNGARSSFFCEDGNARVNEKTTSSWSSQHSDRIWQSYTMADDQYVFRGKTKDKPKCQADEWPPAYFLPSDAQERQKKEWGQYIRWLPGPENQGVPSIWNSFCDKEDGGDYNGQRVRKRQIGDDEALKGDDSYNQVMLNSKLLDLKMPATRTVKGSDGTVTEFSTWKDIAFTRALYEIAFDWTGVDKPAPGNDWNLKENPCWPKDIAPLDPGYAILTDDPWYRTAAMPNDYKKSVTEGALYAGAPPKSMHDAAKRARPDAEKDRPAPERTGSEQAQDPEPPAKAPKPPQKRLELIDNRIMLRDDLLNTTRPLTEEELRHDVEIIQCADRHCRKERRELGEDDHSIVVAGTGPPTVPPANPAVPTLVSDAEVFPALFRRTSLDEDIPFETGIARMR